MFKFGAVEIMTSIIATERIRCVASRMISRLCGGGASQFRLNTFVLQRRLELYGVGASAVKTIITLGRGSVCHDAHLMMMIPATPILTAPAHRRTLSTSSLVVRGVTVAAISLVHTVIRRVGRSAHRSSFADAEFTRTTGSVMVPDIRAGVGWRGWLV